MKPSGINVIERPDWTRPWYAAGVSLLLLTSAAAHGANLRFTERTPLPDSGIQLLLMPKATSRPLPSPRTYYYTFTKGEKQWKEEMFDPFELWRHEQQAGEWVDRYQNTLTIVRVGSPRPRGFARPHASRKEYKAAVADPVNRPPAKWDATSLASWVAEFTTAESAQLKQERRPNNRVRGLYDVTLASPYTRNPGLLLLPAYSSAHRRKHGADWLYIQLKPGPDTDPAEARRILKAQLPRSVIPITSGSLLRDNGAAKVQPSRNRSAGNHSAAYQANCDQVIQSIQNMRDWWYAETSHYIILSNLRSQKEVLVNELQGTMDAMHLAYAKTIPPREAPSAANVIRAFADGDEYKNYVGNNYEWSSGVWMPMRGELVIKASDIGSGREARKRILSIVKHEGLHQYLFYAFGKIEPRQVELRSPEGQRHVVHRPAHAQLVVERPHGLHEEHRVLGVDLVDRRRGFNGVDDLIDLDQDRLDRGQVEGPPEVPHHRVVRRPVQPVLVLARSLESRDQPGEGRDVPLN